MSLITTINVLWNNKNSVTKLHLVGYCCYSVLSFVFSKDMDNWGII